LFVIEDVISILTDSRDPKQYIHRMEQYDKDLKKGWVRIVHTLSISTDDGNQKMLCFNTEGFFQKGRAIQEIQLIVR
jgi:DNA-damage-inducible protein D